MVFAMRYKRVTADVEAYQILKGCNPPYWIEIVRTGERTFSGYNCETEIFYGQWGDWATRDCESDRVEYHHASDFEVGFTKQGEKP